MKNLLIAVSLMTTLGVTHANAACTIKAQQKTAKAKTLYVNGVSVSKKVREALQSQCKFSVSVMSKKQQIAFLNAAHAKKLAKLNKK